MRRNVEHVPSPLGLLVWIACLSTYICGNCDEGLECYHILPSLTLKLLDTFVILLFGRTTMRHDEDGFVVLVPRKNNKETSENVTT